MRVEVVDDYVWEHYEAWTGYKSFKNYICGQFPLFDVLHLSWGRIREHVEEKAEEHSAQHRKLMRFRDSLDSQLQTCVDPFLTQQDKLRLAYREIYINLSCQ